MTQLQIPTVDCGSINAREVLAGKYYRSRTGIRIYIYPLSKVPHFCGSCPVAGRIPFRAERADGYHFYGWLNGNYPLHFEN